MKRSNRRRYFTEAELAKLISAARKGRYGQRDATLVLLMAWHGLRVSRQQRSAAITIALQRSKRAIEAKIRARGHKVSQYSARDLRVMAEAHFDQHRAELLADATTTVER